MVDDTSRTIGTAIYDTEGKLLGWRDGNGGVATDPRAVITEAREIAAQALHKIVAKMS